ncbi:MAG: hypothetical protein HYY06_27870 [Deltaproteobacteria bacterium]|nr:hypothetical protein [Deltaproteobacteria bacterium]
MLEEYADTRAFVPAANKDYTRIRVPAAVPDRARRAGDLVSLQMCDETAGIRILHNAAGSSYHAPGPEMLENCTPWVQEHDGYLQIEYYSGQPGVMGLVQVGVRDNGALFTGAVIEARTPSTCEDDPSIGEDSMLLGTLVEPERGGLAVERCPAAPGGP